MFQSFGIDNVFVLLRLSLKERERLIGLCHWDDGKNTQLLLGTRKNPKITIRCDGTDLIVNVNVPKCEREHNIRLAGPKEIRNAFARFKRITGINLQNSQVLRVDVCLCEETTEKLSSALTLLKCPSGFIRNEWSNGCYFNEKHGRLTLLAYCKSGQFEVLGEPIPGDVFAQCDGENPTILRYELRIGNEETKRLTRTELSRFKLWTSPYFLGSDLHSNNGFTALTSYYQKFMLEKVVLAFRAPENKKSSPKTLHSLKSLVAIPKIDRQEPEKYLSMATDWQQEGKISYRLWSEVQRHVEELQYNNRVVKLSESIRAVCGEVFVAYPVEVEAVRAPILGRIPTAELHAENEDATREPGLAQGVSRHSHGV